MSSFYQQFPRRLDEVLYPGDICLVCTRDVLVTWGSGKSDTAYMFRPTGQDDGTWWIDRTLELGEVPSNAGIAIRLAEDAVARINSQTVPDDFPF